MPGVKKHQESSEKGAEQTTLCAPLFSHKNPDTPRRKRKMKNAMRHVFFPASSPSLLPSSLLFSPLRHPFPSFHLSTFYRFSFFFHLSHFSLLLYSFRALKQSAEKKIHGADISADIFSPDSRHRFQFQSGTAGLSSYCGEITS